MSRIFKYFIISLAIIISLPMVNELLIPRHESKLYEFEIWWPSRDVVILKDGEDYFVSDFRQKASKRITDPKWLAEVKKMARFKKVMTAQKDAQKLLLYSKEHLLEALNIVNDKSQLQLPW